MPDACVSEVNVAVRRYITPMSIGTVPVWTHCTRLVRTKVASADLRLQNVVLLISCTEFRRSGAKTQACGRHVASQ